MKKSFNPVLVIGLGLAVMIAVSLIVRATNPEIIPWREDFSAAQSEAAKDHKPRLLYFTANWCGPCQSMKHSTFADESVKAALVNFVPVKIDVDLHQDLVRQFGVGPIPCFIVIDANGHAVREIAGAMDASEFIGWLNGKQP